MNKLKRAAAFLSALVMLAAVTPELPVKILNESYSITASAETTLYEALTDDTKALTGTQQNDFMYFTDGTGKGFDIQGYYNGILRRTTYNDAGYLTKCQVGEETYSLCDSNAFINGKVYEHGGVQFRVKLEFINNGRTVLVTYDMYNKDSESKTVKIGSSADTMIGGNDTANVIYKNNGWIMEDKALENGSAKYSSYGAQFKLEPVDEFSTLWAGYYSNAATNTFNNDITGVSEETKEHYGSNWRDDLGGLDSGMAWSYTVNLSGNTGARRQCKITIDSALELGDVSLTAKPNENLVQAKVPYYDKENLTQTLYYSVDGGDFKAHGTTGSTTGGSEQTITADIPVGGLEWEANSTHTISFYIQNDANPVMKSRTLTYSVFWSGEETEQGANYYTLEFENTYNLFADIYAKSGTKIKLQADSQPGYLFLGWTDGVNNYNVGDEIDLNKNITLTAQWQPATTYYVTLVEKGQPVTGKKVELVDSSDNRYELTYSGNRYSGAYDDGEYKVYIDDEDSGMTVSDTNPSCIKGTYLVRFDAYGGTVEPSEKEVAYNSTYGELPVPIRNGYTFEGWSPDYFGGSEVTSSTTFNQASDQTIYARWTAKTYNLTLVTNGGTITNADNWKTYTTESTSLPTPVLDGVEFQGWYDNASFTGEPVTSLYGKFGDLTLYAKWDNYIVTLEPNGGSISQTQLLITPGQSVTLPTPTRTGYTFGGWYNGSTLVTSTASITGNVTLTAKWTAVTYTVSFENGGGTGGESSLSIKHNAVLPATVSVPTLEGYAFDGYYTDENGGGIKCYDADGKRVYNSGTKGSFTLYANWVAPEYNVTFETNGGTMDSDLSSYTFGKGAVLPTDITRTGYTFAGWYTNEDFTGSPVTEISADESGDKTFYAKWNEIKYTVNVISELEDGTSFNATLSGGGKYGYDASVTVTAADMLGYDFKGWYEEDGTSPVSTSPSYTLDAKNVTLKAVYAKKSDTDKLTLEVNGAAFKINGGITQYGHCQLKYKAGTEITIEYVDTSKNFIYWKNETGKIVSIAKSHTFIMVDNTVMTANSIAPSNPDNAAVVEFISDTDQVLWSYSYTSDDLINFPSGPSKFGYEFTGWDKTNAEIQKEIADGAVRVVVKPVYKDVRQKYTITVAYPTGTIANDVYTNQVQGNGIDVTAKDISGKVFAYWSSDALGKNVLGYSKSYFMRVTDNETVYAIYADQAVEKKPTIVMTDKFAGVSDGKNKVSFSASRDVTDKYSIIEQGILRSTDSTLTADTFIINATNVKKIRSTDTAGRGVFTLNISVGSSVDTVVYARGYMVLKNNETGMSEIIYSDEIFSGSYNSLK